MSLHLRKFCILIIGSLFIALGVDLFLIPFKVLDGGIIGLALILKYTWGMKVGLSMLLCSLPIFVLAWFQYRPIFLNSVYGLMISSFFINYLEPLQYYFLYYIELSAIVSAMIGGAGIGAGIGLMLRYETSTGGTDLLAHYLSKITILNVGFIIILMDFMIIAIGGMLISMETFLLSLITIIIGGIVTGIVAKR